MEDETLKMFEEVEVTNEQVDMEVNQMEQDKTKLIIDRIVGEVLDFRLSEKLSTEQEVLIREDLKNILDELL